MATIDPTGVFSYVVQKLCDGLLEEIRRIVYFKDAFQGLAEDLQTWKPLFKGFDNVSHVDPTLISWLNSCNGWITRTEYIIEDCRAVDEMRHWTKKYLCGGWFNSVINKREFSQRIDSIRDELSKLMVQVPVLVLLRQTLPEKHASQSHIRQVIPKELVSMEEQLQQILEKLISPASCKYMWVGIWGQGGSGKTIMAKQINNSVHVVNWFRGGVFFLVAGGEASEKQVLQELCRLAGCQFLEQDSVEKLQSAVHTSLQGRRVLLIVDDVWDTRLLDLLEVVDDSEGSRIFVTTRNQEHLSQKNAEIFSAGLMKKEASISLFNNHAFGLNWQTSSPEVELLRECADEIIRLCKGLPLALSIAGSAMAKIQPRVLRLWRHAARTIKQKHLLPGCEVKGLFEYSYGQLDPKEQECFLTMLSFPEDSRIPGFKLVGWWRGEDLIGPLSEYGWEEAEEILRTLLSRSLVQRASNDDEQSFIDSTYRIHDVILELGLEHLLKEESNLQAHERGHLFLTSQKHRQRLLDYARVDPARVRKLSCSGQLDGEASEALGRVETYPSLKTLVWELQENSSESLEEALALVVERSNSLKVFMLDQQMWELEDQPQSLKFEFSSDLLQTLDFNAPGRVISIGILPSSLRWLRFGIRSLDCDLGPQRLDNVELFMPKNRVSAFDQIMRNLNFKNISFLERIHFDSTIMLPGLDMSNLRRLRVANAGIWWPTSASSRAIQMPKLEEVSVSHIKGGGEEWTRMLSGGCPNLKSLLLHGSLEALDRVDPPPRLPALEVLDLQHLNRGSIDTSIIMTRFQAVSDTAPPQQIPVDLPAIVTQAAPQTLKTLRVEGFTLSEAQGAALHQLQRLEKLDLTFAGCLPESLLGLPGVFLQLRWLKLKGRFLGFPLLGEGALPQLKGFQIYQSSPRSCSKVLVVGAAGPEKVKLENLEELQLGDIRSRLLPVELIMSPALKKLEIWRWDHLEKLVVDREVTTSAGSSLELLNIIGCPRMTEKGIPDVFKQMHQKGKLKIWINDKYL